LVSVLYGDKSSKVTQQATGTTRTLRAPTTRTRTPYPPAVCGQFLTQLLHLLHRQLLRLLCRLHRHLHANICLQLLQQLLMLLLLLSLLQQLLQLVACIAVDACCWRDRPGLIESCCCRVNVMVNT
jgi:hypothetical protein